MFANYLCSRIRKAFANKSGRTHRKSFQVDCTSIRWGGSIQIQESRHLLTAANHSALDQPDRYRSHARTSDSSDELFALDSAEYFAPYLSHFATSSAGGPAKHAIACRPRRGVAILLTSSFSTQSEPYHSASRR